VKLAVASGVVLVLVAGTALYFGARLIGRHNHPAANRPPASPSISATPSPTPSATLGPYGHIASRQDDPKPLTLPQLFPASFTAGGASFVRTASRLSGDCVDAASGAGIQGAVSSGGCNQAARATYLSAKDAMMGTIGVFNLRTAKAASKAAHAAGAANFVAQLPGRRGLTHKLGQGTGIEEGLAKGHYLILIWAELTSLHRPRTTAQKAGLERFMTELLQHSANLSLTDRMVNGVPS
jgi:hypothetical protein